MRSSLFILHALCFLVSIRSQDVPDQITFAVTYRDFLPSSCFFLDAGNDTIKNEFKSAWDQLTKGLPDDRDSCEDLIDSWQSFVFNGLISGNPDFEARPLFTDQAQCVDAINFPAQSCINNNTVETTYSIIKTTLVDNGAGIPKPVYCTSNLNGRCGEQPDEGFTQTRGQYFAPWYADDLKYNKRIGQSLTLVRNTTLGANVFIFDSSNPLHNDQPDFGPDETPDFFGPLDRFKSDRDPIANPNPFFVKQTDFADPRDAPAWPNLTNIPLDKHNSFWFTTEVHTTFEFRTDAAMTFEFSGDDDFWAFVNGEMVIDLGGLHPKRTASIDLLQVLSDGNGNTLNISETLGLVNGNVYTLDVFHAERQTEASNFKITTTLFAACNVLLSGTESFNFAVDQFSVSVFNATFLRTDSVKFIADSNFFKLAEVDVEGTNSFVFTQNKENVGRGFTSKFLVRVSEETEGFAFVIQNRENGLVNYPISGGSNFNFKGVENSFAVVFDLCVDRFTTGLCKEQNVRLHYPEASGLGNDPSSATQHKVDSILRNFARNEDIEIEIIYYGGKPDFLEVYIDKSLFLREKNFNITGILNGLGGHVGLTATSTARTADIVISDWVLTTVEVEPKKSELLYDPSDFEPQTVVANGVNESEGFKFQTNDFCDNKIEQGTLDELVSAVFIEKLNLTTGVYADNTTLPQKVNAKVVDNNDGSYSIKLVTDVVAEFDLFFAFGEDCFVSVETFPSTPPLTPFVPTVSLDGNSSLCFYNELPDAVVTTAVVLLPTEAPTPFVDEEDNSNLIVVIASVGGGMLFIGLLAALVLIQYRRTWNKNKGYIAEGNLYKMEVNTKFDGADDYTMTGTKLLKTQEEILRLQSLGRLDPRSDEIQKLKYENEEMKQMIRSSKQRQNEGVVKQDPALEPKNFKKNKGRMEF